MLIEYSKKIIVMDESSIILEACDDILGLIFQFVSYVDVMSMRWTCKRLNLLKMPSFKDRFVKKLFPLLYIDPAIPFDSVFESQLDYEIMCDESVSSLGPDGYHLNTYNHEYIKLDMNTLDCMKKLRYNICEEIYNSGACVAGSFILDCLFDTNYHNDIDIYDLALTKSQCSKKLRELDVFDDPDGLGYWVGQPHKLILNLLVTL